MSLWFFWWHFKGCRFVIQCAKVLIYLLSPQKPSVLTGVCRFLSPLYIIRCRYGDVHHTMRLQTTLSSNDDMLTYRTVQDRVIQGPGDLLLDENKVIRKSQPMVFHDLLKTINLHQVVKHLD